MIRALTSIPLVAIVLVMAGVYYAYGEVDPCRVLAVEKARRTAADIGVDLDAERWTRLETSQMSTGECVGGLADSWRERLSQH